MSESLSASDETQQMWDYIRDNQKIIGIPLSNSSGLDILNVLRDIYETIDESPNDAKRKLSLVATVILGAAAGDGDAILNEIKVVSAMENFDLSIEEILNEEPK